MEEIINSIINGQRKQALEQMERNGVTFSELAEELIAMNDKKEIVTMLTLAENRGYITYVPKKA